MACRIIGMDKQLFRLWKSNGGDASNCSDTYLLIFVVGKVNLVKMLVSSSIRCEICFYYIFILRAGRCLLHLLPQL